MCVKGICLVQKFVVVGSEEKVLFETSGVFLVVPPQRGVGKVGTVVFLFFDLSSVGRKKWRLKGKN